MFEDWPYNRGSYLVDMEQLPEEELALRVRQLGDFCVESFSLLFLFLHLLLFNRVALLLLEAENCILLSGIF